MTEKQPWRKYVKLEDINNSELSLLMQAIGFEHAIDVVLALPGLNVVIPRIPFRIAKEKYIMENYDGKKSTLNALAMDCNISPKQAYKIIKRNLLKKRKNF